MAKPKLTKTAVDAATPSEREYELRDTTVPGFLLKSYLLVARSHSDIAHRWRRSVDADQCC